MKVEKALAWIICSLSLAGSVVGLWHVCIDLAKMPELIAAGTIAGFDGSALVFGLKVARSPRAVAAWVGVVLCALLSAAAQVLAAPPEAGPWRLLHGSVAIAAIWTLHNAVRDEKDDKKRQRRPSAGQAGQKPKGAGREAAGAGPGTTSSVGPLADQREHDASVLQLDDARRAGDRRATSLDAGPPNLSPLRMAERVAPLLGDAEPSQRRVWDLCKSIDSQWTQANGRIVATILKERKEETGTGS